MCLVFILYCKLRDKINLEWNEEIENIRTYVAYCLNQGWPEGRGKIKQ